MKQIEVEKSTFEMLAKNNFKGLEKILKANKGYELVNDLKQNLWVGLSRVELFDEKWVDILIKYKQPIRGIRRMSLITMFLIDNGYDKKAKEVIDKIIKYDKDSVKEIATRGTPLDDLEPEEIELAKILVQNGANPVSKDKSGKTFGDKNPDFTRWLNTRKVGKYADLLR